MGHGGAVGTGIMEDKLTSGNVAIRSAMIDLRVVRRLRESRDGCPDLAQLGAIFRESRVPHRPVH